MLNPLLLDAIGPIALSPAAAFLILFATVGAAVILVVARMVTGELT
jgi:uncharacterized membrane protein YeaQ/YmgE (transglycosylase-associated protein family)